MLWAYILDLALDHTQSAVLDHKFHEKMDLGKTLGLCLFVWRVSLGHKAKELILHKDRLNVEVCDTYKEWELFSGPKRSLTDFEINEVNPDFIKNVDGEAAPTTVRDILDRANLWIYTLIRKTDWPLTVDLYDLFKRLDQLDWLHEAEALLDFPYMVSEVKVLRGGELEGNGIWPGLVRGILPHQLWQRSI